MCKVFTNVKFATAICTECQGLGSVPDPTKEVPAENPLYTREELQELGDNTNTGGTVRSWFRALVNFGKKPEEIQAQKAQAKPESKKVAKEKKRRSLFDLAREGSEPDASTTKEGE